MHEASMYEHSCFLTLTYRPGDVPVDYSLDFSHMEKFIKRVRDYVSRDKVGKRFYTERYDDKGYRKNIRYLQCGEYGDTFLRPHFHIIFFNLDFKDKKLWQVRDGFHLYTSEVLSKLWPYGFSTIGSVSFQSAAYVARYSMKKVTGDLAEDHYRRKSPIDGQIYDVVPENATMSRSPGIGASWFDKYYKTDIYDNGYLVVNGHKCLPPRYYDERLKALDLELYESVKERRLAEGFSRSEDNTFARLLDKVKVRLSRITQLLRTLD